MDWESDTCEILLNPRLNHAEQDKIHRLIQGAPSLRSHIWLSTSGSSGVAKMAALSKKAILTSALSVNRFLNCSHRDIWLNPLPLFHVGGLGIYARAYLSCSKVVDFHSPQEKWDPIAFHRMASETKTTVSALVPAQVFDLVSLNLKAPESLRSIVVGGGSLHPSLYVKARHLGWKVLPSYGLTECSSQVATASPEHREPHLHILPHVELRCDKAGRIGIKSEALLTLYAFWSDGKAQYCDPKREGWYTTEDLGEIVGTCLHLKGRETNFIKIGGESVDLNRLEKIFEETRLEIGCNSDAALAILPDERLGHVIHMAITASLASMEAISLQARFNTKVLPFEKIRKSHQVNCIPRSALSKILKHELMKQLI